jgi:1-deoxy-D-xylulose-5-phosphate reductoisomerase
MDDFSSPVAGPAAGPNGLPSATAQRPRSVLILGSTGSIGTQALEVIAANRDRYTVTGLAAGGADPAALAAQAIEFGVAAVAVGRPEQAEAVVAAVRAAAAERGVPAPRVHSGPDAVLDLIDDAPADVVLNGIDGSRGLAPTLRILESGAVLALANKESLIAGGPLVLRAARPGQIVPVDSEHSALAQCLRGGRGDEVAKLVLTASGGPFRGRSAAELGEVTVENALAHPTWSMGPVVTCNSATLVNKGLELIEAHLLFAVPYDRIDVVVHPQSIVHSMVTFTDGSTLAQASPPTMKLPIALGLSWPDRIPAVAPSCAWDTPSQWTFEPVDHQNFPAIELARRAGTGGGCLPAIYNAANEVCVAAFFAGRTRFLDIVDTVARVLDEADEWQAEPETVADVLAAEGWARDRAQSHLDAVASGSGRI